jgi:hypothetical protein
MKEKLNTTVLLACVASIVLLSSRLGYASDNSGSRLDGAWIVKVSNGLATLNYNFTFTAQDPDGLLYTAVMKHSKCSAKVFGMFPKATHQSDSVGVAVKTAADALEYTVLGQGIKKGELADEIVYISVLSGQMRSVDPSTMEGEANIAYYLASQDADQDGIPDANQVPVICIPCTGIAKCISLMPPAEPTLQLPTPSADAPVHEVTIETVGITDPWPAPDIHRNPGNATLRIGDKEYQGTAVDSDYNYTYSKPTGKGGFRRLVYDFGELGLLELWERMDGEYKIIDIEGGRRHHEYDLTGWIIRGTGAFANAAGIIQSALEVDFTWEPEPGVVPIIGVTPICEEYHSTSQGIVRGIDLPE